MRRRQCLAAGAALMTVSRVQAVQASASETQMTWPERTALLDGRVRTAADWQGKPLLVVFWAVHCPFCLRHNAHLHRLMTERPDFPPVLTVAQDRDGSTVERYLRVHDYRFDVTLDEPTWRRALAVRRVIPSTVPINAQGRIGLRVPGEMFAEDLLQLGQWATGTPKT